MKKADLLAIEKKLLMQLNGLPVTLKMMLSNVYNGQIMATDADLETEGEEQELFCLMEEILNGNKDAATGG